MTHRRCKKKKKSDKSEQEVCQKWFQGKVTNKQNKQTNKQNGFMAVRVNMKGEQGTQAARVSEQNLWNIRKPNTCWH